VGDSLVGDHLLDGDLVIIEKRNTRYTENSWRLRRIIKDAIPMRRRADISVHDIPYLLNLPGVFM
jgi:hypothetical protein